MKIFLFFLACILVNQSFGQQQNTNHSVPVTNGVTNNNNVEEIKLEVPEVKNMPELKKQAEGNAKSKEISQKPAVDQEAKQSGAMFSSYRKIASTQTTSRSPSSVQQEEMNKALHFYKANAPESFEYHYFTYTAGNYDISLYPHLKKAQEMKPSNSDVISQMAAYDIIVGDSVSAEKNLTKLVEIGKIEQEVLLYDGDLLNSVPQNSVLLTHGFDDGFGTFYLNSVNNARADVKIISLDFMQSKVYRDSLQEDGFNMPASTTIDVQFLNEFCQKNESRNLYLSMTFPKPYLEPMIDKLSVHGLVFAYGAKQSAMLKENESLWNKMLKTDFIHKVRTEKGKQLSANYLPMLFYLRESYEKEGKGKQLVEIDKAIDRIGMQSNRLTKVNSMRGLK